MRTLYLECRSGISGDMTVGALLDLEADQKQLEKELNSLKIEGYALKFGRTKKAGIDAFDFDVLLEHPEHPDQHHEHAHAHSHHGAGHEHHHSDGEHGHSHEHEHHHHGHVHRNLGDVLEIIESGEMSAAAKETAKQIFHIIAESEAKAHGLPVEEVHFHEVGAVDSIIDICGAAICLEQLKVDRVIASPLSEGQGSVRCAHGLMPVPVPAVVNIAAARQVPMKLTEVEGELVTPTGIAILSAVCDEFTVPKRMNIKKIGYGAGNKDLPDRANVLRAYLLEESDRQDSDEVVLLETNIDDQTGEQLAYACGLLRDSGALDVWLEPIYMKKNRPAYKLCVLVKEEAQQSAVKLIFQNTTAIGIRKSNLERAIMQREIIEVETSYGLVQVKCCKYGEILKQYVEFESAKQAAEIYHVTIEQVIQETLKKICQ